MIPSTIYLRHTDGHLNARAVQQGNEAMHVSLTIRAGYLTTDIYMTVDEARQLAAVLQASADAYQEKRPARLQPERAVDAETTPTKEMT